MATNQHSSETHSDIEFSLFDGRTKLLPCQLEMIQILHDIEGRSYRYIASVRFMGNISAHHVRMICNPELYEKQKVQVKAKNKVNNATKRDVTTHSVKLTRAKKKQIEEAFKFK